MECLGVRYANGWGVTQDYGKAREIFQKAADADYSNAMVNLGLLYHTGEGVARDDTKAREWFQKAADAGSNLAMNNLGALWDGQRGRAGLCQGARMV
jgi:uncharacterized protein